jgi:ribosome-binding factor A
MHPPSHRHERLADQMRDEVAEMVAAELKDPRIGLASVCGIELSPDYRHVRVLVTVLGEADEQDRTVAGLSSAAGFVGHELARRLRLRRVPEVVFVLDRDAQQAERVDELLREIKGKL